MHHFYSDRLMKGLNREGIALRDATIVILGLTFKENCNDYRNSRTIHLIHGLKAYGSRIVAIDPWLDAETIKLFGAEPATLSDLASLRPDAIVITVPHKQFNNLDLHETKVVVDIKGRLSTSNTSLHNHTAASHIEH